MNQDVEIPNLLRKKEEPEEKLVRIQKQLTVTYILNILLFAVIAGFLYLKPVRFSLVHIKESTNFANAYLDMEKTTKKAAEQVLNEWADKTVSNKGI